MYALWTDNNHDIEQAKCFGSLRNAVEYARESIKNGVDYNQIYILKYDLEDKCVWNSGITFDYRGRVWSDDDNALLDLYRVKEELIEEFIEELNRDFFQ